MDGYVYWILLGFLLLIVELTTGTFYLLVLGMAGFAAALVAWFGGAFWAQAATFGSVALIGLWLVARLRGRAADGPVSSNTLDVGQMVAFESWIDEAAGTARVRYRNASWDAQVLGAVSGARPHTLYIRNVQGGVLQVSESRPG